MSTKAKNNFQNRMHDEETEPLDPEEVKELSPDEVFLGSGETADENAFDWLKDDLAEFSATRRRVASRMGNKFFGGQVDPDGDGMYAGLFEDAAMTVYLCSLPDSEVLKAWRKPESYTMKFLDWLEENDVEPSNERGAACSEFFFSVLAKRSAAAAEPVERKKPGDKSAGKPGKRGK